MHDWNLCLGIAVCTWSAVNGIRLSFASALFSSFSKMRPNLRKGRGRDAFFMFYGAGGVPIAQVHPSHNRSKLFKNHSTMEEILPRIFYTNDANS